jgi:hypothetical protein
MTPKGKGRAWPPAKYADTRRHCIPPVAEQIQSQGLRSPSEQRHRLACLGIYSNGNRKGAFLFKSRNLHCPRVLSDLTLKKESYPKIFRFNLIDAGLILVCIPCKLSNRI